MVCAGTDGHHELSPNDHAKHSVIMLLHKDVIKRTAPRFLYVSVALQQN